MVRGSGCRVSASRRTVRPTSGARARGGARLHRDPDRIGGVRDGQEDRRILLRSPNRPRPARAQSGTIASMQVIAADPSSRSDRLAVARSTLASVLLILGGAAVALLCLGTPLLSSFTPSGRPSVAQTAAGVLAWGFAIIVPAALMLLGVVGLVGTLGAARATRPRPITARLARSLGSSHIAATDLVLPGGRRIHEMVLGPFGIVVLGDVPPPSLSRHVGTAWEIRGERGRWIPIEAPLDRTARDAERVRGWLTTHDRDFLVRVYAAIVTDDQRVERTDACTVVAPGQFAAWLEGLPAQRGLTPDRHAQLVGLVRSVAARR